MVSKEELLELFEYRDGKVFGKSVSWRRKESNSRVCGKELGTDLKGGYKSVNFKTKDGKFMRVLLHRLIWAMHYDDWPELIDHRDQNPKNNLISNLRLADRRVNMINTGLAKNNTSGVKGVYLDKLGGYVAYIKPYKNSKRLSLGRFKTLEEAFTVRKSAEERFWGDIR